MAIAATIIGAWQDGRWAYLAVRPNLPAPDNSVEYLAQTPLLDDQGQPKSLAQLKSELLALLSAKRAAAQVRPQPVGLSGGVTL